MQWYYAENGKQQGPVEFEQLQGLAQNGRLKPDDLVWNASMGNQWAKARSVADLFAPTPPALPGAAKAPAEWSATAKFKSVTPNRDLTAKARTALAGNWGIAIGGLLIYGLIYAVLAGIFVLGQIVSFVIGGAMTLGWTLFYLNLARGKTVEIGQLFDGFKQFGDAFVAYLLIMLLVLAWSLPAMVLAIIVLGMAVKVGLTGNFAALGAVAYWIPLIFVALIPAVIAQFRYSLTYYILNDIPGVGPLEAIDRSAQMMAGNKWKLFCLQCRFIGWGFLCMFTFGLGLLWLIPYMTVSTACFYDNVKDGRAAH